MSEETDFVIEVMQIFRSQKYPTDEQKIEALERLYRRVKQNNPLQ